MCAGLGNRSWQQREREGNGHHLSQDYFTVEVPNLVSTLRASRRAPFAGSRSPVLRQSRPRWHSQRDRALHPRPHRRRLGHHDRLLGVPSARYTATRPRRAFAICLSGFYLQFVTPRWGHPRSARPRLAAARTRGIRDSVCVHLAIECEPIRDSINVLACGVPASATWA